MRNVIPSKRLKGQGVGLLDGKYINLLHDTKGLKLWLHD